MTASELLINGLETTFWVSLLIIAALALRAPVTARFGSRAAILLWSLPALRLFAPTLTRTETVELPAEPAPVLPPADEWRFDPQPVASPEPVMHDAVMTYAAPVEETASAAQILPMLRDLITADVMASAVLSLWFLGVIIAMALCAGRCSSWRRTLLAEAVDVPEDLAAKAEAAAERVGTQKNFTLVVSGAADTPQLMGWRKPLLALPTDFAERYDEEEQEMALLHELIHLRRHDLSVLAMSELSFALQWFNPLTNHARKALRADQEAACDEAVRDLGVSTKGYAELLLKAASIGRPVPALTLDHSLKERIVRMQNPLGTPLKRYAFILTAGVSALAVAGFTASSTTVTEYVHPEEEKAQDEDFPKLEDKEWERFVESLRAEEQEEERKIEILVERLTEEEQELDEKVQVLRLQDLSDEERAEVEKKIEKARAKIRVKRVEARDRSEMLRERREEARSRIEEALERSSERNRTATLNVFRTEKDEGEMKQVIVMVDKDKGETLELLIGPDGKVANRDALKAFTDKHDIDIDIRTDVDGEFGFDLDTNGKNVSISKPKVLRFSGKDDARPLGFPKRGEAEEGKAYAFAFAGKDEDGEPVVLDFSGSSEFAIELDGKKSGDRNVWVSKGKHDDDDSHGMVHHDGNSELMILLSDPFEGLKMPPVMAPKPPQIEVKAPKIEKRETDEGTWILIPEEPDMSEFESAMEAFEVEMEAFGERMEAWGEKMEEVGEAIEELADECADHQEESDEPIVLSERIDGSGKRVRAVCATGGQERFASDEMMRFVERQGLSREEKKHYAKSLRLQR